jgi:hypothetical protein
MVLHASTASKISQFETNFWIYLKNFWIKPPFELGICQIRISKIFLLFSMTSKVLRNRIGCWYVCADSLDKMFQSSCDARNFRNLVISCLIWSIEGWSQMDVMFICEGHTREKLRSMTALVMGCLGFSTCLWTSPSASTPVPCYSKLAMLPESSATRKVCIICDAVHINNLE